MKYCTNHKSEKAKWQCPRCKSDLCSQCYSQNIETPITAKCPNCGYSHKGATNSIGETLDFSRKLLEAFSYPFKGMNAAVLFIGVFFFFGLRLAGAIPLLGIFYGLLGGGYMASFFMSIVSSSSEGRDEIPDWPEWDSLISQYFMFALPILISILPMLVYIFFSEDPDQNIVFLFLALGGLYLPMALGSVSAERSFFSASPTEVLPLIFSDFSKYLITFIFTLVVMSLLVFGEEVSNSDSSILSFVIFEFVSMYMTVVALRMIGIVYANNYRKL